MCTSQELIDQLKAKLNNIVHQYKPQYSRNPTSQIKDNFKDALANESAAIIQKSINEGVDDQAMFLKAVIQTVIDSYREFNDSE